MKIVLFGASGHIGTGILNEALQREHDVTAIVRDQARVDMRNPSLTLVTGDIARAETYRAALHGADAVIASISARRDGDLASVARNAGILLDTLPKADVKRLAWVGGAGTLEAAPGKKVLDDAHFPAAWKPEAQAQADALEVFRASKADIDWVYISPAAMIEDGERSGIYRIGGDRLLVDANGNSRITIPDYAVALLDRIEKNDRPRQRITVAY
jgi:putative NADH-flavin reductase